MVLDRIGSMEPAKEDYPIEAGLYFQSEELRKEEMTNLSASVRIAKCMSYSDEEHKGIIGLCLDDGSLLVVVIGEKEKYKSIQQIGLYGKKWRNHSSSNHNPFDVGWWWCCEWYPTANRAALW